jgi:hypothetical protein
MLINASDQTPHNPEATNARRRHVHDANTLLRVLCHKKDKIASTFLRIQYHLPRSSGETKNMISYGFNLNVLHSTEVVAL